MGGSDVWGYVATRAAGGGRAVRAAPRGDGSPGVCAPRPRLRACAATAAADGSRRRRGGGAL